MITPIIMESELGEVKKRLEVLGGEGVRRVHFDIGDALFSDLLTIAPADLQQFDLSKLDIDFHLLVDDPTEWIEECVALSPKRIIGQIEHMGSQKLYLEELKNYKTEGGLALRIETPIEEIEGDVLESCKTILLLSVEAGTSGSKFDESVIEKIKNLRKIYKHNILIDGGINPDTYKRAIDAGASEAGENSNYWRGKI